MNINHQINVILNELNAKYHELYFKLGMSDSEACILYLLYDMKEPITQNYIVQTTGVSKQTIHSAIQKLKNDGIIEMSEENKKNKFIIVTKYGQSYLEEKIKPIIKIEESIFQQWTQSQQEKYISLMEKFQKQFTKEVDDYE